jgi:hypothetical protein
MASRIKSEFGKHRRTGEGELDRKYAEMEAEIAQEVLPSMSSDYYPDVWVLFKHASYLAARVSGDDKRRLSTYCPALTKTIMRPSWAVSAEEMTQVVVVQLPEATDSKQEDVQVPAPEIHSEAQHQVAPVKDEVDIAVGTIDTLTEAVETTVPPDHEALPVAPPENEEDNEPVDDTGPDVEETVEAAHLTLANDDDFEIEDFDLLDPALVVPSVVSDEEEVRSDYNEVPPDYDEEDESSPVEEDEEPTAEVILLISSITTSLVLGACFIILEVIYYISIEPSRQPDEHGTCLQTKVLKV